MRARGEDGLTMRWARPVGRSGLAFLTNLFDVLGRQRLAADFPVAAPRFLKNDQGLLPKRSPSTETRAVETILTGAVISSIMPPFGRN